MRVIAGIAKGRRLFAVPGDSTRPITDRVKGSLFDILADSIVGAHFLDLFAGTGSVGIEALSRGASRAVFVESNRRALTTLRRNLQATGLGASAVVAQRDVFQYLDQPPCRSFDIIYVAPPQYKGLWSKTLLRLDGSGLLDASGKAIAQIFPKEYGDLPLQQLVLYDRRKYGSTLLCFYGKRPST